MDEIKLISPSMEYDEDIMQFRQELIDANDADSFAGCGSLRACITTEGWLAVLKQWENIETCPRAVSHPTRILRFGLRITGLWALLTSDIILIALFWDFGAGIWDIRSARLSAEKDTQKKCYISICKTAGKEDLRK